MGKAEASPTRLTLSGRPGEVCATAGDEKRRLATGLTAAEGARFALVTIPLARVRMAAWAFMVGDCRYKIQPFSDELMS